MFFAKQGTFLTAISLGSLLLLLTACSPPGGTDSRTDELRAEVDALKAEVQRLTSEVAALKGAPVQTAAAQSEERPAGPMSLSIGSSAVLGGDSAPVTMFAYNDYACAECAAYATEVLPQLVSEYVDSGNLRIVMREAPDRQAGRKAMQMAKMAICAGRQGKYRELHDWFYTSTGALSKDDRMAHIQELGLNVDEFKSCAQDKEIMSQIRADSKEAGQSPIQGAPGFLLGLTNPDDKATVVVARHLDGLPQLAEFQAAIDELLTQAAASN